MAGETSTVAIIAEVKPSPASFPIEVDVVIIGAGAAGMTAALAAHDAGCQADSVNTDVDQANIDRTSDDHSLGRVRTILIERDETPSGSTALSSGLIPAAATRWQQDAGVIDSVELMVDDILTKAKGQTARDYATTLVSNVGAALEWLTDTHGVPYSLVEDFNYPGHSALRMHGHPQRTGRALMQALNEAVSRADIPILTNATVDTLYIDADQRVVGVSVTRPDGQTEAIGCCAVILACNGYGGNKSLVRKHIPTMADALYFGHPGNQGHAIYWGDALGAACADLGGFQGHGSVASPLGILITWAVIMEGGYQVNVHGHRFSNEQSGYSEQAAHVLGQPRQLAWNIYDQHCHDIAKQFEDYREAESLGAVISAHTMHELATKIGVDAATLVQTASDVQSYIDSASADEFGRPFKNARRLQAPFYATRVTGALFHTQGGLSVNQRAQVVRADGSIIPNLFATGGAARGVSGPADWGYLSGNGLLSAISLGRIAGQHAAAT